MRGSLRIKRNNSAQRNGSMLIELMGVLTAGTALLCLAVGMIHQSFHLSKRTQGRADLQATLGRLAGVWRSDAHRATRLEVVSDTEAQWFDSLGEKIIYRFAGNEVIRELSVRSSKGAEMNQKEHFVLGEGFLVRFELTDKPTRGSLVVLEKTKVIDPIDGEWIPIRLTVESNIGSWNRFGEVSR